MPILPRYASKRDTVCGRTIPRGATVVVSPWVVHRHRKLWSDPETFDPDRFSEERSRDRARFTHIPFAAGPGTCSGATFAMTKMLIIIATLARRFRFRLDPDRPVVPYGAMTLHLRGGLWMYPEGR